MAKLRIQILVGLGAFLVSMMAHRILMPRPPAPQNPPCSDFSLKTQVSGKIYGTPKATVTRISQEDEVYFESIGLVRVSAHEDIGFSPALIFTKVGSDEKLLEAYVHSDWQSLDDDHPGMNPQLRFTVRRIKGFPSPLVIAVSMSPGGSDDAWESFAVAAIKGQLEQLNYEHLQTNDDGGFFFGDLGNGIGLGAAQWNFVWGETESHPPPHRYEIKLYKWNGRRFEWEKVMRTRAQYNCAHDAVRAYGFPYTDVRASFPEWEYLGDWREMCNEH